MSTAPVNSDKMYVRFHLYCLRRAVRNPKQAEISKRKYMHPPGFEPATFGSVGGYFIPLGHFD